MTIFPFLLTGLVGALLMFAGDMTLYYSKEDFVSDGTMEPIINIMKKIGKARLYIGSVLGPTAAFAYCIGYYHIVLMTTAEPFGMICFLINSLGIILGGAYHSHFVYLGRIGRLENKEAFGEVADFMKMMNKMYFVIIGLGFLMLTLLIALGFTVFPRWLAFFTPGILYLLLPVMKKLPKGLHMVIYGGWSNLISVIYYVAAIIILLKIS